MTSDYIQLIKLVEQCMGLIHGLKSHSRNLVKSNATCVDYLRLAKKLIDTSVSSVVPLREIVQRTTRATTFYKRIAALQYYLFEEMYSLSLTLPSATDELICKELAAKFLKLSTELQELEALRQTGMTGSRSTRHSKRQALSGLPNNWRTLICNRGENGKYSLPLIVCAMTGARPQELVHGINIRIIHCDKREQTLIQFYLRGAKVKANQGQPTRTISYDLNDENPLIKILLKQLKQKIEPNIACTIQIQNSTNFSVEVRRLAKDLWPKHKHAVTPYCFRHQWAADVKALGDGCAVSRGLGHVSTKTRRHYGTARQTRSGDQLKPINIEAERPLKEIFTKDFNLTKENLYLADKLENDGLI